jgi:hypothetical protein
VAICRLTCAAPVSKSVFDLHGYTNSLVPDIERGDIRRLTTLAEFAWVVTTLSYGDLEELATHLIGLGVRDHCSVALLLRAEWIVPKARRRLVHGTPALRRRRDADGKAALGSSAFPRAELTPASWQ